MELHGRLTANSKTEIGVCGRYFQTYGAEVGSNRGMCTRMFNRWKSETYHEKYLYRIREYGCASSRKQGSL